MKTYVGSLQKRGRRWYLVVHRAGRQRWFALKTELLAVARMRAAKIAPADPGDETAWLEQLVREGEAARRKLAAHRIRRTLTWENIGGVCASSGVAESSDDSRRSHERWFGILRKAVGRAAPAELTRGQAAEAMRSIGARYVSAPRILRFFRQAWRALGLDEAVWTGPMAATEGGEHYRRLSIEEIRKVHRHLAAVAPPLADMVLVGYSTGLRLSDVAELEMSELDGAFLKVCPNKTRRHKPKPLKIPLTPEARKAVGRLAAAAAANQRRFLFAEGERRSVSRRISNAFRRCGVLREGKGRASFHSLRATFISAMDDAGVPPHITDSITGHGGGGMHARYTQPTDAALLAAVRRALPRLSADARGEGECLARPARTGKIFSPRPLDAVSANMLNYAQL